VNGLIKMEIVRSLDEDLWRDYVGQHPEGTIFHTPEIFQVFARTRHYRPEVWAVLQGHSEILAFMLPVQIHIIDGWLRRLTTRTIIYGGILCKNSERGKQAIQLLLAAYEKSASIDALFTEFRNFYCLDDYRSILTSCGYQYEDHLNYLIDLDRPPEAILNSIGKRTRKRIRKGLRSGLVTINDVSHAGELDAWYATLQKTYRFAHVPLADRSLFDSAFNILCPRGMARFLMAQVNGATGACSVELAYKDKIYGWYGGTDRAYGDVWPNEMLTWHVLEWGASRGYRVYDFGGAGKPGEEYGARSFKAKFGGELVNYGRFVNIHKPWLLKISKPGYEIFRRFR